MSVIKCKMCGGDLNISEGMTVAECEYCGTKQTVPAIDNEKKLTLFARANRLRLVCEFDKAAGVYESIVADFPTEAEAYWGLVLCRYGIEYVSDPATGKKVPTCHRSSFDSILEDGDFEQATENADAVARKVYREEAKAIEAVRRGILEVSSKEAPYDIFICYKETDEAGKRTVDSVIAQDVYDALTEKGYRVFFSRISLEDKLGSEYEPYIFAALSSAKVMLAFGTDYEYFNAVWVKNEWSRFLTLIAAGQRKTLIPCYKGVDAYDMPKEFQRLQAQDMGKVGAIQDLIRGIDKIFATDAPAAEKTAAPAAAGIASLLKRGQLFLEDGDWVRADEYFEKVLDIDPENGAAYAGKLCLTLHCHSLTEAPTDMELLGDGKAYFANNSSYSRAKRYGDAELQAQLEEFRRAAMEPYFKKLDALRKQREYLAPARGSLYAVDRFVAAVTSYDKLCLLGSSPHDSNLTDTKTLRDIVAIDGGGLYGKRIFAGLRADGTVTVLADNPGTAAELTAQMGCWYGLTAISACVCGYAHHFLGLRADGTVLTTNDDLRPLIEVWQDMVEVAAGVGYAVGLRKDGTVVAAGSNKRGQCGVEGWHDIVSVASGGYHTVGLREDGTVVAVGNNEHGQCKVDGWRDIVSISANSYMTVGIHMGGTAVTVGTTPDGYRVDLSDWKNLAAVFYSEERRIGVCQDGRFLYEYSGDDVIAGWRAFMDLPSFGRAKEQRRASAGMASESSAIHTAALTEIALKRKALEAQRDALRIERSKLGMMQFLRKSELMDQIVDILGEIDKLNAQEAELRKK